MSGREGFRDAHPSFCDPTQLRVPGPSPPAPTEAVPVQDWKDIMHRLTLPPLPPEAPSFKPTPRAGSSGLTLKDVMGNGNEGTGFYLSFRLRPEAWGVYLSKRGLEVLTGELQRLAVRGFPEARTAKLEALSEFAFHLAFDYVLGHAKFHAAVDDLAADEEVARGDPIYGLYLQGPYQRTLAHPTPADYNMEEAMANVVALRIFLNPGGLIELGHPVEKSLHEDDSFRWNSYLMSGVLTAEFIFLLRILPPGYKDFMGYLGKRTEITAYAHMGIQYNLNQEEFNKGLAKLSDQIFGKAGPVDGQKLLRVVPTPLYLY